MLGRSDENLFFHPNGGDYAVYEFDGKERWPLEKWRKMGFDKSSIIADPLFEDPANDDYRLRPESPAHELGFQPINIDRIGIRPRP